MNYLLDTCVISELVAPQPNARVVEWVQSTPEERLYLSVLTIGELQKGIAKLAVSRRRQALSEWLHGDLLVRFKGRLVALDVPVLLEWGNLSAALTRAGKTMPAMDALIAASARQGGFTLVTRNVADFAATGVPILNPWE